MSKPTESVAALVKGEPVAAIISGVLALVNALTVLVTAFGVQLTVDQTKAVYLVANAAGALVGIILARRKVKPWPPGPNDEDVAALTFNLSSLAAAPWSSGTFELQDAHPAMLSRLMGDSEPVLDHPDFASPPTSSTPHAEPEDADDVDLRPPRGLVELHEALAWEAAVAEQERET